MSYPLAPACDERSRIVLAGEGKGEGPSVERFGIPGNLPSRPSPQPSPPSTGEREKSPSFHHSSFELDSDFAIRVSDFPLLIVRTIADRQVIVAQCPQAAKAGIRLGMTLTQARALCGHVQHAEHEPRRDAKALLGLARWLMRFTPVVAMARTESPANASAADSASSPIAQGIYLDLTGCDRLFGGLENLLGLIRSALRGMRITAYVAVAPTPGAAWALADAGADGAIVEMAELPAALAPLPPISLRIGDDLAGALHHLGLNSIGQLARLPRDVLPARFGKELLRRLDQAMGDLPEPLVALEHPSPVRVTMEFDGPVGSLEAIWIVCQHLLRQIVDELTRRGAGARKLDLELSRAYAAPICKSILLTHASRDGKSLFRLLQCTLEELGVSENRSTGVPPVSLALRATAGTAVLRKTTSRCIQHLPTIHDEGYTAITLSVPLLQQLSDEQIFLLDRERCVARIEIDHLIDRLRLRLGEQAAHRVALAASHLPERAWEKCDPGAPADEDEGPSGSRRDRKVTGTLCVKPSPAAHRPGLPATAMSGFPMAMRWSLRDAAMGPIRPFRLFAQPYEIRVMVTPSDDAEGQPAAFAYEQAVHPVIHCLGPERIDGCWWDGHAKTRDYFEVEDPTGRRFWIFRVAQTRKWYLHGDYG